MPIAARPRIEALMVALKLNDAEQSAVLGGNTLRLLKRA
jgi:hypothetical protein